MPTLELRPRSATEIVDAAFRLLRANYLPLVTLAVVAQLPTLVIRIWAVRLGFSGTGATDYILGMLVPIIVVGLLLVLVAVMAQCALTVATSQVYLGGAVDNGAAIRRGLERFLYVLLTGLVVGLGFGAVFGATFAAATLLPSAARIVLFIALFAFTIIIAIRLIPLNTVVVLEDCGPIEAIKRALFLGEGLFGHMFLSLLLGVLIYIGIALVAGMAVVVLAAIIPALKDPNVSAVFATAAGALVTPLLFAIIVTLYYDLRIRREGFDVEMMSRATPR